MADQLEIVILGTDKASPVFKDIGDALGKSFKIGTGLAIGGLTALTGALTLSISEAIDAEQIQAKLGAVIKSTGGIAGVSAGEANKLAESLSKVTKFSDDTIVGAETLLLTFTNVGEKIFPQATEAALNMAEMFGSADQAALQLGKALNDPVQGLTALRRVGVSFSQQQEDMIKAMVESGDIMGAQRVILAELEKEFGGVARAAGNTLGGKLVILKNRLLDVAEGVGLKLLPPLTQVATMILDKVLPAVERFGETITPVFESAIWPIQRLFANLFVMGASLKDTLVAFFDDGALALEWFLTKIGVSIGVADKFTDAFREVGVILGDLIFDKIVPFVKEHAEGFKAALIAIGAVLGGAAIVGGIVAVGAAIATLFNPITLAIGAIGALAFAWQEDWGGIRTYFTTEVWPAIKPALEDLKDWLEVNIPKAIIFIRDKWETVLLPALEKLKVFWYDTLKPALGNLSEWFITHIPVAIDTLKYVWDNVLMPAFEDMKIFWDDYLEPVLGDLKTVLQDGIPAAIDILVPKLKDTLQGAFDDLVSAGSDLWGILQDIGNTLSGAVKGAIDTVMPFLDDLAGVINTINAGLDLLKGGSSSGGGGGGGLANMIHAAGAMAGQASFQGALNTGMSNVKKNYNKNYTGPQSLVLRDSGGRGLPGNLYGIGVPELFIPDRSGTFAPLSNGQMVMDTLDNLSYTMSRILEVLERQGLRSGSQLAPNYNLTIHSNSSDERIRSDYESMRVWAGA